MAQTGQNQVNAALKWNNITSPISSVLFFFPSEVNSHRLLSHSQTAELLGLSVFHTYPWPTMFRPSRAKAELDKLSEVRPKPAPLGHFTLCDHVRQFSGLNVSGRVKKHPSTSSISTDSYFLVAGLHGVRKNVGFCVVFLSTWHIVGFYLAHQSGTEPIEDVWNREAKLEGWQGELST